MDDFLSTEFGGYEESKPAAPVQQAPQNNYQGNNNYQSKPYNGGGNNNGNRGYNNNNGQQYRNGGTNNYQQGGQAGGGYRRGGGGGFQRKPDELQDIYLPIGLYIDEKAPQDAKEKMFKLADKLLAKGFTIRFNADDIDSFNRYKNMSPKCEDYGRWKNYNGITCEKNYFNGLTPTHYATLVFNRLATNNVFEKWNPGTQLGSLNAVVKDKFVRDMRILLGQNNKSNVHTLIVWTPDGAYQEHQLSKDTGETAFIIGAADHYGWRVLNANNPECHEAINNLIKGNENE